MTDKLGDRMKEYENISRIYFTRRTPLILRIDGRSFHTFTKGFEKPHDIILKDSMSKTAQFLCENIQGVKIAYIQSDEISLLLTDYDDIKTDAWFGKNLQKTVSLSASIATLGFNKSYREVIRNLSDGFFLQEDDQKKRNMYEKKLDTATFDSRAFILPKEEVINYFIWRQNDATRNAIQGLGQKHFSHKDIQKINTSEMQEKLFSEKGINFNDEVTWFKRGWTIVKKQFGEKSPDGKEWTRNRWVEDNEMPILTHDRTYIEKFIGL
jgi:tRNA(His) 5'-end guanylyltransferase